MILHRDVPDDDRKTPRDRPAQPKRPPTHGDRNESRARVYTPPQGFDPAAPAFVDPASEPTDVGTDVQVFRAVKALHERLTESETAAQKSHGELKLEVVALKAGFELLDAKQDHQSGIIEKFDEKLDAQIAGQAKIVGYIEGQRDEADRRSKSPSSLLRMVQETTTTTLAGKIVDDQIKQREWWRTTTTKVIGAALGSVGLWELIKGLFHKAVG